MKNRAVGGRNTSKIRIAYKGKVFSILAEKFGKNSLSLKSFFVFKNVPIHKAIHHCGVSMDVNVEFQGNSLCRKDTHTQVNVKMYFNKVKQTILIKSKYTAAGCVGLE